MLQRLFTNINERLRCNWLLECYLENFNCMSVLYPIDLFGCAELPVARLPVALKNSTGQTLKERNMFI